MKSIFASSLMTLGLLVTGAAAQEGQWRTATPRSATPPAPASVAAQVGPAARLQKPVPLAAPTPGGTSIQQLTYSPSTSLAFIVRAKNLDPQQQPPLPLPPGPLAGGDLQGSVKDGPKGLTSETLPFSPTPLLPGPVQNFPPMPRTVNSGGGGDQSVPATVLGARWHHHSGRPD